jgi:thiamine-phosphate pyrophosphorylase
VIPAPFPALYAILDLDTLTRRQLDPLAVLDAWLAAGVRLVQLRAKTLATGALLTLADDAVRRAHAQGATIVVNDRADVARMAGADGVHVGQDDLSPTDVRAVLGPRAVVGLSTHSLAQLGEAILEPVTYVAIGPVFPTATKAGASDPAVGIDVVKTAAETTRRAGIPLVAIGGITLAAARDVLAAGASSAAVITDLLVGDVAARARDFVAALNDRNRDI